MGRLALAALMLSMLATSVCAKQDKSKLWTWVQFGESQEEDYEDYEVYFDSKAHAAAEAEASSHHGNRGSHKGQPFDSKPYDDGVDDDDYDYSTPTPGDSGPKGHAGHSGGKRVTKSPMTTKSGDSQTSGGGTGKGKHPGTGKGKHGTGENKPGTGEDKPETGGGKPGTGGGNSGTDEGKPGTDEGESGRGGRERKPDEVDDPGFLDMADTPNQGKATDRARSAFYGNKKGEMLLPEGYGVRYGAGTNNPSLRWPNATVPYEIDPSLDKIKNKISRAMDTYHNETCIRFVPRSNEENYIYMTKGQGCSSYVGMSGGRQEVSIGSGCEYVGTILHELGHACGLYHEHQRSDRDDYIKVYTGNITQGAEDQFTKINPNKEARYTKFDYDSIMIYGEYAFSNKPGQKKTMEALNGAKLEDPYNKQNLDTLDLYTVRNLYECNGTTTNNF